MLTQISGTEQIIILLVCVIISLVLHEAMHGYAAYLLGDTTAADQGRLTLNPLKSIDPIYTVLMPIIFIVLAHIPLLAAKPVPIDSRRLKYGDYGMAIVGLAGPATNLVLAIIGAILFRTIGVHGSTLVYNFLLIFVEVNAVVMIFNLIPFPPLDGSRVLYAFAPEGLKEIMAKIESYGLIAILVLVFLVFQINAISSGLSNLENHLINLLLG